MYIFQIEHCQQHKAPHVLFLKRDMHVLFFFFHDFFSVACSSHTLRLTRQSGVILACLQTTVAIKSPFLWPSPSSQGQSYLKLFSEAFLYLTSPQGSEVHPFQPQLRNNRRSVFSFFSSCKLTRIPVCIFSVPTVHHIATTKPLQLKIQDTV